MSKCLCISSGILITFSILFFTLGFLELYKGVLSKTTSNTGERALLYGLLLFFAVIFCIISFIICIKEGCFLPDYMLNQFCWRKKRPNRTTRTPVTLPDWFTENGTIPKGVFPRGWSSIPIPEEKSALIQAEVENLMYDTWQYEERLGRDAANLHHSRLKIKAIYVVHNNSLIEQYQKVKYDQIAEAYQYVKKQMPPLTCVNGQKEIRTVNSALDSSVWMYDHSVKKNSKDINEVYLFHGTKTNNIPGIMKEGFSLEKASNGLFGKALYLAESSEKADQYTDASKSRRQENLCIVIAKTALGRTYVHRGQSLSSLPCTQKQCFTPSCSYHTHKFNSAVAGLNKRFREFLIYDTKQCYPHVFVFYDRIDEETEIKNTNVACYLIGPKCDIENFTESTLIHNTNNQTKINGDLSTLTDETEKDIIYHYKDMRVKIIENVDLSVWKIPCCKCLATGRVNKMIYDKELMQLSDDIHYLHIRLNTVEEKMKKHYSSYIRPHVSMTEYNATKKLFETRKNTFDMFLQKWIVCHSLCQMSTLV